MKARYGSTALILLTLATVAFAGVGIWPWMSPAPELQFRANGEELTAVLPLVINNSPAIVETSFKVDQEKKEVSLGFVVIQNADLYRRSARQVSVEWHLGKIKREDYTFQIKGSEVSLTTEKLQTLLPKNMADKELKATR